MATATGVRCWHCNAKIANRLGPGSDVDCRHCGAKNRV